MLNLDSTISKTNPRTFLKFVELIGKVYKKKELHSEAEEEATGETSQQPAALQALFTFEMKLSE